jgi:hypothetical protein
MVAVGPGAPAAVPVVAGGQAAVGAAPVPFVSPLRGETAGATAGIDATALPSIAPAEPMPTYQEPPGATVADPEVEEEPALPDEARARAADLAEAPTRPTDAAAGSVLHVRFFGASGDRLLEAMRAFRDVVRARPGETRVLVHIDVAGSTGLPMELRPVAYDAELLAEIRRRLGEGLVELHLASA